MGNIQKIFFGIFGGEDKEAKIIDEYKYLHLFFDTEMLSKKKDFLLNFFDVVFKKASFFKGNLHSNWKGTTSIHFRHLLLHGAPLLLTSSLSISFFMSVRWLVCRSVCHNFRSFPPMLLSGHLLEV